MHRWHPPSLCNALFKDANRFELRAFFHLNRVILRRVRTKLKPLAVETGEQNMISRGDYK